MRWKRGAERIKYILHRRLDLIGWRACVRGYMEAFGLNQDELYTVCTKNPAKVVGLELN